MTFAKYTCFLFFSILCIFCHAQDNGLYPIKKNGKWGIIDKRGNIIIPPNYDAISSFKHQNYAVVQNKGKSGLVDSRGKFVFQPTFDDIRVISKDIFGIEKNGVWHIMDKFGRTILKDYDDVKLFNDHLITFYKKGWCGLVDMRGNILVPPNFHSIHLDEKHQLFVTKKAGKLGLYSKNGQKICGAIYSDLKILNSTYFLVKSKYKWGLIDHLGKTLLPEHYSNYKKGTFGFLLMYKQGRCFLYSMKEKRFIHQEPYQNFFPLNEDLIVFQKFLKMGVIHRNGTIVIPPSFHEISIFSDDNFRVRIKNKWGIINHENELLSPIIYDYISPLNPYVSIVKKDGKFGILNYAGKLVANTIYDNIEIEKNKVKAYQDKKLSVFRLDEEDILVEDEFNKFTSISIKKRKKRKNHEEENYQLAYYEWYYSTEKRKWGLRNNMDGRTRISPQFDFIDIKRKHHLTIAGTRKTKTQTFGDFPVRFNFHFHLIDNITGVHTSEQLFRDVRFSDFDEGKPTARAILENGRHALIDKKGQIVCTGYAYIGDFHNGLAPMAMRGTLSMAKSKDDFIICPMEEYLISSYGSYIIGDFGNIPKYIPNLSCSDCAWGYIDTLGRMKVPPDFDAAMPFKNNSGIVKSNGKWGLVNHTGAEILPCQYSRIHYFNDESDILHVEARCEKYGLVNSLGTLVCNSQFQEIRSQSDQLLAFKSDKKWGYMLPNGRLAINAQYAKASDFHEGIAAVSNGSKWGFINKAGQLIVDYQYSRVGNFNSGLAWVKTSKGIGYINTDNEFVIPVQFKKAFDFQNGIARVATKDRIRLIDHLGSYITNHQFDDLSSFDKYGLAVARSSFKNNINYYLVDRKGNKVGSQSFRRIYPFSEGIAVIKKKNKYGYINAQGQIIIAPTFDKVSQFSEGFAWVKVNGNCGYINKMGKFIVEPEFSKCKDFEDGKAVVFVNARKGGLVDTDGGYVLEPKLNRLLAFTEGKGLVKENKKFYFVRESGEIYEGYYDSAETFEDGIAFVEMDGNWGIINKKGVPIITPKYESIERMDNGLMKVKVSKLHGIVRANGQFLLHPTYEYVNYMGNGIIRIEQGGKIGYMNLEGRWIWGIQ